MTDWRHFYEHVLSDEEVRQQTPRSPALRLGANHLFIIGVSANKMLGRPSNILDNTLVCKMTAEVCSSLVKIEHA